MKSIMLLLMAICLVSLWAQELPPLPSCYHTYSEIYTELTALQTQYPSYARIFVIGHTQQDNIPIYAMKISDNVAVHDSLEPSVLLIGQVHAEEVLGVEITMNNINTILANRAQQPYNLWISNLEMWFVPTLNPEGHNVVTSNQDVSYRKNKRDMNNNGVLDFDPHVGYDLDGVDINRNMDFNWVHGDSLWQPGGAEVYDYYRGPSPTSEAESQALQDFCDTYHPVYSIIWHSSRSASSGLAEKVYYPLNYANTRPAPDLDLGTQIGTGVAGQIITQDHTATYEPSSSLGRKAAVNDWMYMRYGTIAMTIECGAQHVIQPDSTLMMDTINRCKLGVYWLLNRALRTPYNSTVPSQSMLTGTVKDAVTGEKLKAEVIVVQKNAPWFYPRYSDPVTGAYWRPITNGTYTLKFRKKGYAETTINNVSVSNGSWTLRHVSLQPLPAATINLTVRGGNNLITAKVVWGDVENDTYTVNGTESIPTFAGVHRVEISADGYYPYVGDVTITGGVHDMSFVLSPATPVFTEDWESGMDGWVKNSAWTLENELAYSGHALTDSWGGNGFYDRGCNSWIRTASPITLPASGNIMLHFQEHLYTEFVYDSVRVEVSADTLSWQTIYSNSGKYDWWHPQYVSLNAHAGQSLYFRFRLTDISNAADLTDPGWTLDDIRIVTGTAVANEDINSPTLPAVIIYQNYPNPFNPETTLKFFNRSPERVTINIYNLRGQKVKEVTDKTFESGLHQLKWEGKDEQGKPTASGMYLCRIKVGTQSRSLKMIMLK